MNAPGRYTEWRKKCLFRTLVLLDGLRAIGPRVAGQVAVRRHVGISRRRLTIALASSFAIGQARPMSAFTPPGLDERLEAIGPTNGLPGPLRRALEPRADFAPLPQPRPSDWLANHVEPGQSFADFLRS